MTLVLIRAINFGLGKASWLWIFILATGWEAALLLTHYCLQTSTARTTWRAYRHKTPLLKFGLLVASVLILSSATAIALCLVAISSKRPETHS
ncbi:MAG: hypothetical protein E5V93_11825 [Mesorhizobium sp.]|nr:MAG: hypothetical protein E5V93_11825 [Mesorhizobium sp.]